MDDMMDLEEYATALRFLQERDSGAFDFIVERRMKYVAKWNVMQPVIVCSNPNSGSAMPRRRETTAISPLTLTDSAFVLNDTDAVGVEVVIRERWSSASALWPITLPAPRRTARAQSGVMPYGWSAYLMQSHMTACMCEVK